MVSAFASANELVLGQIKVNAKSNEITAIPELLELLEISGCLVTIDAMGCQRDIASKIVDKDADYLLAVKGNQGKLHEAFENHFSSEKVTIQHPSRTYALTALIKDGLSQSLPSEKLLMKSQIASLSASFLTR